MDTPEAILQNIECAIGTAQVINSLKEVEERYEIGSKQGTLNAENMIAYSIHNLTTDQLIEQQFGGLMIPKTGKTSLKEIALLEADLIIDEEQKKNYIETHEVEYLLKQYEEGVREITLDLRSCLPNGRVCWVRNILHILKKPEESEVLLFEYSYDVNITKSLDLMMDFAVNDRYDLIGSINFEDNGAVMLYGEDGYNIYDEVLVEDNYVTSLYRFVENAVLPEEQERYIQKANIDKIKEELKDHDAYEFYFHMQKNGQIKTKKVRYISYNKVKNICLFIQTDVTEAVEAEQRKQKELREALESAKSASHYKTKFLSQMSHEIRTPMNAIMGMAQLAREENELDEKDHYIEKIQASSEYLLGVINDILDMTRIENGKFELHQEWVSAEEILHTCIDMLEPAMQKKKIQFIYPILRKADGVEFYVDALRTKQVYMNLLNNALKFTPEGGTVSLKMENISFDENESIDRTTISDTGCGMSEEFLERIFQPFEQEINPYTSQVQGTGLGLALVKQIVTAMGGEITVQSELGKGSTFSFITRYKYRITRANSQEQIPTEKISLAGKHILLADDHLLNREIATKLLEKENMQVTAVCDGKEVVDKFLKSEDQKYDLILMDIMMPHMNGLEATRAIRALSRADAKTVPIVAMTANAFEEDKKMSLEAGMNAHLAKPIEPQLLYQTLEKWMSNR